jgi:cytochrome c-type biogenesis protein CcmH
MAELEKDAAEGRIDAPTLQELRTELERNLLTLSAEPAPRQTSTQRRLAGWLTLILLPVLTVAFYIGVVAPKGLGDWWKLRHDLGPTIDIMMQGKMPPDVGKDGHTLPDFIRVLQDRLQKQPENPKGWFLLGMHYVQINAPEPAQTAFEHAWQQDPDNSRYEMAYAETRIFGNDGQLEPVTQQLLQNVLQQEPNHEGALALLGMSAYHSGDYALAIDSLEKLQALRALHANDPNDDPDLTSQISHVLASAHNKLNQQSTGSAPAAAAGIEVKVQVDRRLAGKFQPGDSLYIFARALNGPPMPVAVVRRVAGDLPLTVQLDDSQSVMPARPLSAVNEVAISARISKHGTPDPQAGDLEAVAVPVRQNGRLQHVDLLIQSEHQ